MTESRRRLCLECREVVVENSWYLHFVYKHLEKAKWIDLERELVVPDMTDADLASVLERAIIGQITLHLLLKYEQMVKELGVAVEPFRMAAQMVELGESCRRQLIDDGLTPDQADKISIRARHLAMKKLDKAIEARRKGE